MADPQCVAELLPGLELAVRQAARQELPTPADHFFADNFPEYKAVAQDMRGNISRLLDQASQVLLLPKHRSAQAAAAASTAAGSQDAADPAAAVEEEFESAQQVLEDCLERLDRSLDAAQQQLQEYQDDGIARPGASMTISGPLASWRLTGSGVAGAACVLDHAAAGRGWVGLPTAAAATGSTGSRPQDRFATPVDNSNTPWWPDFKHLAGRVGPPAAGEGAAHPYREELQQLSYQSWQLEAGTPQPPPDLAASPVTWVDTPASLGDMVASLAGCREVALDLEHHSYHSFQGFTCLLQVSSRAQDWLVDVLALRGEVGPALAPLLADPGVVKVLHGADHDVVWLQRDFGLYLVNMFDTGQAARVLGYPSASLAHLLSRHAGFTPDKRFQLADWRLRPLSAAMRDYARCDTHFLLFCYDVLRAELVAAGDAVPSSYVVPLPPNAPQGALGTVLERSRQLCATSYQKELLSPSTPLATAARWQLVLAPRPMAVFCALFAWRDGTARRLDESTGYVLPKGQLMTLAKEMPATADKVLKALGRSGGAYVKQHAEEVAGVIAEALVAPLAPNLLGQDPAAAAAAAAAAGGSGTDTAGPNPAAADGSGLQEPDAAAARQLVKPKVLGALTGIKRPAPGGMFGAAGRKPAKAAAVAAAGAAAAAGEGQPGGVPQAAQEVAAGAQDDKAEAEQQQQQQVVQQEVQQRQQVVPKPRGGSSSMAAVFGKRPAAPSAAAALFKPAGAAAAAGGGVVRAPPSFRLPFQLQPSAAAAVAAAGLPHGASTGALQQHQQEKEQQLQARGSDSSGSSSSDENGEGPLQQTTAADIRAVVAQLRAGGTGTPAGAGPQGAGGGRKRRAADALGGNHQQQQDGEGDSEEEGQQQEQGSEEEDGDEEQGADAQEEEEEEEEGGLAAGADYVSLAQAFGHKRKKQRGVRTAPTSTAAAAAGGGGGGATGTRTAQQQQQQPLKRPKPMFKRNRGGGDSSDSDQDSGSEDLADLAQQHLEQMEAAGGGFDYAAAKQAALANAQPEQPSRGRGRGRRGGRGGRGKKQSARGAAMAAAKASLAAVRGGAGAANPYAIPSEHMIRGGKRSAVAPRSGNRNLSFK